RAVEDLTRWLRTSEGERGAGGVRTGGAAAAGARHEHLIEATAGEDWLAGEIRLFLKRTLKRLDVTSRSLIALIEPGSCFAGPLLELALACDRQYMLDGLPEDAGESAGPAAIILTAGNFRAYP